MEQEAEPGAVVVSARLTDDSGGRLNGAEPVGVIAEGAFVSVIEGGIGIVAVARGATIVSGGSVIVGVIRGTVIVGVTVGLNVGAVNVTIGAMAGVRVEVRPFLAAKVVHESVGYGPERARRRSHRVGKDEKEHPEVPRPPHPLPQSKQDRPPTLPLPRTSGQCPTCLSVSVGESIGLGGRTSVTIRRRAGGRPIRAGQATCLGTSSNSPIMA